MEYKKTENENVKRDAKTVAVLQLGGKKRRDFVFPRTRPVNLCFAFEFWNSGLEIAALPKN